MSYYKFEYSLVDGSNYHCFLTREKCDEIFDLITERGNAFGEWVTVKCEFLKSVRVCRSAEIKRMVFTPISQETFESLGM